MYAFRDLKVMPVDDDKQHKIVMKQQKLLTTGSDDNERSGQISIIPKPELRGSGRGFPYYINLHLG